MHRMILEGNPPPANKTTRMSFAVCNDSTVVPTAQRVLSLSSSPPSTTLPARGLSMQIEMELVGDSGNILSSMSSNSSSFSSSFSRSVSISTIDDRIRRGLRKHVAQSWISWAESWCMRLWADNKAERARRRVSVRGRNKR
jgi:hypothetical protein